ncbi:MAG TPA: DUF6274 family protein [Streptomyces sp.]|uniref:DUF6274 family protein n=1 Tax=Streptomyces sp. TaxID=1931 RepID=UPI002CFA25B9|nr:DUF6274 family protein [Streptomyces sp.]HWU05660.1 DUF6274 family protein [Streptomyces sp.]
MPAPTERHEIRALLRAHLAAASAYRHLTRHCPVCHRLLRLAMEPLTAPRAPYALQRPGNASERPSAPENPAGGPRRGAGAAPPSGPGPDDDGDEEKGASGNGADRPRHLPEDRSGDEGSSAT